jgi:hypothetical protein
MTDRSWHRLLAPLPADVAPRRKPVAPPEILATPEGASITGWENLTVELSAGTAGLRHVLLVLDGTGTPIAASDAVLFRLEGHADQTNGRAVIRQESIGGRIQEDGTFLGTCWSTEGPEPEGEEEWKAPSERSEPSANQIEALLALVADVARRQPPRT